MGPTWVLSTPGGPHVGLMNLAVWVSYLSKEMQHLMKWSYAVECIFEATWPAPELSCHIGYRYVIFMLALFGLTRWNNPAGYVARVILIFVLITRSGHLAQTKGTACESLHHMCLKYRWLNARETYSGMLGKQLCLLYRAIDMLLHFILY